MLKYYTVNEPHSCRIDIDVRLLDNNYQVFLASQLIYSWPFSSTDRNLNTEMLSRGLSNASSCASQPKPSKFGQTHPLAPQEHKRRDSEIAHKEAIAAASFAFERASGRPIVAPDYLESDIGQTFCPEEQVQPAQRLGRKHSIRFTGLTAVPILNRSITRRVAPDQNEVYNLPDGDHDRSHAIGGCISSHQVSGMISSQLDRGDAHGSRAFSGSISGRKMQRARSMFSLRGSVAGMFSDTRSYKNSKIQQKSTHSVIEQDQFTDVTGSRLQRSFSFLQGERDHMASGLDWQKNQNAVAQLARDQYFRELKEVKLKADTNSSAADNHPKFQRAFRMSVRSSSKTSQGSAVASPPTVAKEPVLQKRLGKKVESLSSSLKQKLKRVFHRPSDTENSIPIQQLDASRPHFGGSTSALAGLDQKYYLIPSPDDETLRKVRSREPSLGKAPGFFESVSPARSIHNVGRENGNSPSFANWGNAIPGFMLTSTQPREKKRLSVIQEHGGPHQPSLTSLNHADLSNAYHTPTRSSSTGKQIEAFIDRQNMYLALQQKIYDDESFTGPEEQSWGKGKNVNEVVVNNFDTSGAFLGSQPLTSVSIEGLSSDHGIKTSHAMMAEPIRTSSMTNDKHLPQDQSKDYSMQADLLELYSKITPQQTAEQKENVDMSPKRPLREIKATFFPSSMRIERRSVSPYRRLMGSGAENDTSEFDRNTPVRVRSESGLGSASIYSRTSSGNTPKENQSSVSLTKSETSAERGTSIIITTLPQPYEESLAYHAQQSEFPKKFQGRLNWTESEMSHFEQRELGNDHDFNTTGKENRHKKENAQIYDDDLVMRRSRHETHMKGQVHGNPLEKSISQPSFRDQIPPTVFTRSPLLEIGQTTRREETEHSSPLSPNCPTVPRRSLCLTNEISLLGTKNQGLTMPGQTSSHESTKPEGSDPLGNQDGYILKHDISAPAKNVSMSTSQDIHGTPTPAPLRAIFRTGKAAKLQGHNSPERLARIRRLQSSNSLSAQTKYKAESNMGESRDEPIESTLRKAPITEDVSDQSVSGMTFKETKSSGVGSVVDLFLSNRWRNTTEGQDSTIGAAFL